MNILVEKRRIAAEKTNGSEKLTLMTSPPFIDDIQLCFLLYLKRTVTFDHCYILSSISNHLPH